MFKFYTLLLISVLFSKTSMALAIPKLCYTRSENAVESFRPHFYDKKGIEADQCRISKDSQIVYCDVSAMKGEGAASDSYRVYLDRNCTKVLRLKLVGEE